MGSQPRKSQGRWFWGGRRAPQSGGRRRGSSAHREGKDANDRAWRMTAGQGLSLRTQLCHGELSGAHSPRHSARGLQEKGSSARGAARLRDTRAELGQRYPGCLAPPMSGVTPASGQPLPTLTRACLVSLPCTPPTRALPANLRWPWAPIVIAADGGLVICALRCLPRLSSPLLTPSQPSGVLFRQDSLPPASASWSPAGQLHWFPGCSEGPLAWLWGAWNMAWPVGWANSSRASNPRTASQMQRPGLSPWP